jgi:nucleotide-binding universal stress UspA family protein
MKAATARTAVGFRNILYATDFSAAAANAIPYVKRIAKHYEANLVALNVHTPTVNPMTPPQAWPALEEAEKRSSKSTAKYCCVHSREFQRKW